MSEYKAHDKVKLWSMIDVKFSIPGRVFKYSRLRDFFGLPCYKVAYEYKGLTATEMRFSWFGDMDIRRDDEQGEVARYCVVKHPEVSKDQAEKQAKREKMLKRVCRYRAAETMLTIKGLSLAGETNEIGFLPFKNKRKHELLSLLFTRKGLEYKIKADELYKQAEEL